jgi:sulfoxide reductase heme-binding subunit YedZ
MSPMRKRNTWVLVLMVPAVFGVALLVQRVAPVEGWQSWLVRGLALSGYLLVFLAAVSAASLPALAKAFGRPFIGVHHVATLAGFAAMLAHPLTYSLAFGSLEPLVPRADSLYDFLLWAGRPALALFIVAVVAALLRMAFKKGWRFFHLVVYLAFILVTIHANLIGTSFQSPVVRVVSWAMAAAATVVFVRRRLQRRKVARPAPAPMK